MALRLYVLSFPSINRFTVPGIPSVVVVRVPIDVQMAVQELAEQFNPVLQMLRAVDNRFIPGRGLLLDSFSVPQPSHVNAVCGRHSELRFPFPRTRQERSKDRVTQAISFSRQKSLYFDALH